MDGLVDFHRNWDDYEKGFGDPKGNFWLGNAILRRLTEVDGVGDWTIRVDLTNERGSKGYLTKSPFRIIDNNYTLRLESPGIQPLGINPMLLNVKDRGNHWKLT